MIMNPVIYASSSPSPTPSVASGGLNATAIVFFDNSSNKFAVLYPEYCTSDTLCFKTDNNEYYYTDIINADNWEMGLIYDNWSKQSSGGFNANIRSIWFGGIVDGMGNVLFVTRVDLPAGRVYYCDAQTASMMGANDKYYTNGVELPSIGDDIYDVNDMQYDTVNGVIDSTLKMPVGIEYNGSVYLYNNTLTDSIEWEDNNGNHIYTAGTKLLGNSSVALYDSSFNYISDISKNKIMLWLAVYNSYYCYPTGSYGVTTESFDVLDGVGSTIWVDKTSNLVGANVYSDSQATSQIGQITGLLN